MFLPENDKNIVGKAKQDKDLMRSGDWLAAKGQANHCAAQRVVSLVWSEKKSNQLRQVIGDTKDVLFITQPTSSGQNVVPINLANRLAIEFNGEYINGNDYFDVLHAQQSKHIPQYRRAFDRREYETVDPVAFKEKVGGRSVFIVEDILTTGGSVADFTHHLMTEGIKTESIVALMGDKRLQIDTKSLEKLDQAIHNKNLPIQASDLAQHLTRAEAGGLIMMINSARSDNARKKLTENLQGLCDKRTVKDLGGNSITGRYESTQGRDKGNETIAERIQTWGTQRDSRLIEYKSQKDNFLKALVKAKEKTVEKQITKDIGKGLEI